MTTRLTENDVEEAAITWFRGIGYSYLPGPELADERGEDPREVILWGRLRAAIRTLNPDLPSAAHDEAERQLRLLSSPDIVENNKAFHELLVEGVPVEVRHPDGTIRGDRVWLVDFDRPSANDFLVVNQLTVRGGQTRRPDLVVYVNGLPLAVFELKDPKKSTPKRAWNQLQTYKRDIPQLFTCNEILVCSDGARARVGSLTAGWEWFGAWRTADGETLAEKHDPQLGVAIGGLFPPRRLLDYVRHYVMFEDDDRGRLTKIIAAYHQMFAVEKAVEKTVEAASASGNRRVGVVWHTQGSGKSISMCFYAGRVTGHPDMENPTLVVVTDRNDLDDQLFKQFARARRLIPTPEQATSRDHLRELLGQRASGGVIFTTMQKFQTMPGELVFPTLSARRNIVVVADEAHRSQYGFTTGLAANLDRALPNASRIGFTGTPIEFDDRSTPEVFGHYIDVYPVSQAVEDEATVPIYYEARLARLQLEDDAQARVDEDFEDVTEDVDEATRAKLQTKWSQLAALVGSKKRLRLVARDIVEHFRKRTEIVDGKAFVVCMSRKICVDLYREITRLRPDWHDADPHKGQIKVVMTGAADDPPSFQPHLYAKPQLKVIEKRFKQADDPLRMVIVCDMWLTGFNVPSAHTMYLDKPLKGHTLMQAIARVNRVYRDKPSGLVVDYLGVAQALEKAVTWYDRDVKREEQAGVPIEAALGQLQARHEVVVAMFHGFQDWSAWPSLSSAEKLQLLMAGAEHILSLDDGKKRYREAMLALNKAAGIALHREEARRFRVDVAFFQEVQRYLARHTTARGESSGANLDAAIRQIVSGAVVSAGVVDVFGESGLDKPEISILSDRFLKKVQEAPHRSLALETLRKLLADDIQALERRNVVQAKRFSEQLTASILKYTNRSLDAAQVIMELVALAQQLRDQGERGRALGLTEPELAFYDALADHGDVRTVMGDADLATIARELVEKVRGSATLDWTQKESVRARMRAAIKRILRRRGYPPDQSAAAVETVLRQAETLGRDWGVNGAPEVEPVEVVTEVEPVPAVEVEPEPEPPSAAWLELHECVDPSVRELLEEVRLTGLAMPEPGFEPIGSNGRVLGPQVELAWPEAKVAVVLDGDVTEAERGVLEGELGWRVLAIGDDVAVLAALQ